MICPVCKTSQAKHENVEVCSQCGSDLLVYDLLGKTQAEMQMKDEAIEQAKASQKSSSQLFMLFQIIPATLLLIGTLFGIFVGMRFLAFLNDQTKQHLSVSDKWSQTGFEQLLQMNATIKQELDLILSQRQENQMLVAKLQALSTLAMKNDSQNMKVTNTEAQTAQGKR